MASADQDPSAATQSLAAISTASTRSSPRSKGLQATRTPSFLQLAKRTAARERVDGILETGRQRAESMGPSSHADPSSPRMQPLLGTSPRTIPEQERETSPDIALPGPSSRFPDNQMNYQATNNTQTLSNTRSRRSGATSKLADADGSGGNRQTNGTESDARRNASDSATGKGGSKAQKTWFQKVLVNFQSIELENKGSVARDHLALERTFLAWLRTSLAFASIGIAVTQLFRLNSSLQQNGASSSSSGDNNVTLKQLGKPLGATFLAISILILGMGYNRYIQSQRWILRGKFPASRGSILLISLVAFALMALSLVVVIVVQPSNPAA